MERNETSTQLSVCELNTIKTGNVYRLHPHARPFIDFAVSFGNSKCITREKKLDLDLKQQQQPKTAHLFSDSPT